MRLPTLSFPLALALWIPGCAATATSPPPLAPRAAHGVPPVAGFVVVWADHTEVIPIDASLPIARADGMWVLSTDASGARVMRAAQSSIDALALPSCPCPDAPGACDGSLEIETIAAEGPVSAPFARCACARTSDGTCDATPDVLAEWDEPWCACGGPPEESRSSSVPMSLVGGVLHLGGEYREGTPSCGGMNLYSSFASTRRMVATSDEDAASAVADSVRGDALVQCRPDGGGLDATGRPWSSEPYCERDGDDWRLVMTGEPREHDTSHCDGCGRSRESAIIAGLRSGHLWTLAWGFWSAAILRADRVTPRHCPSAEDPCGDPSAFPAIASAISDGPAFSADYWVATDGSAALLEDGIYAPGEEAPSRALHDPDRPLGESLGVRYHADLRPLLDAMRRVTPDRGGGSATETDALGECAQDAECGEGRMCDGGVCHGPCARDEDCTAMGVCGGFCGPGGRCLLQRELGCDERHRCDPGLDCGADGRCAPHVATLAASDRELVDRRRGRSWGNRCLEHVRARDYEAAQAACEAGLAMATDPDVRAAILYNLGLADEGRGWRARAIEHYEESLELRESDTVSEHLSALRGGDEDDE